MHREAYDRRSADQTEQHDQFVNPIETAWTIARPSHSLHTQYTNFLEAFILTVTAGLDRFRKPAARDITTHLSNFVSFCSSKLSPRLNSEIAEHDTREKSRNLTAEGDGRHFYVQARRVCHGRRFFVTSSGLFGLGHEG